MVVDKRSQSAIKLAFSKRHVATITIDRLLRQIEVETASGGLCHVNAGFQTFG